MRLQEISLALYHGTSRESAETILTVNRIDANTAHDVDGQLIHGVSASRSRRYTRWWAEQEHGEAVVVQLNLWRLRQRYRIIPHDVYGDRWLGSQYVRSEAEEFIIGDIEPAHRYISALLVQPQLFKQLDPNSRLARSGLLVVKDR